MQEELMVLDPWLLDKTLAMPPRGAFVQHGRGSCSGLGAGRKLSRAQWIVLVPHGTPTKTNSPSRYQHVSTYLLGQHLCQID